MIRFFLIVLAVWATVAGVATADVIPTVPEGETAGDRGAVTSLPIPRFVSMKADEGFVRRGPSSTQRIDWVFRHQNMPLQVVAEYGHWRRVVDRDGAGGWVHYSLLSGVRTVLVEEDMLALRKAPQDSAREVAYLELGVIARLGKCEPDWCQIRSGGYRGWARKTALWGVTPDEIRE